MAQRSIQLAYTLGSMCFRISSPIKTVYMVGSETELPLNYGPHCDVHNTDCIITMCSSGQWPKSALSKVKINFDLWS